MPRDSWQDVYKPFFNTEETSVYNLLIIIYINYSKVLTSSRDPNINNTESLTHQNQVILDPKYAFE